MTATPETGFLVVADFTGYTAYLSRSELEHAPAGAPPIDGAAIESVRGEREAAFGRLAHVVARALPVLDQREVAS